MSILSFLAGVLSLFISNFPVFITKLRKKIPTELDSNVDLIIQAVNNIKKFVDSPIADVLTDLIPGKADDAVKEWLRKWIPEVLTNLGYLKDGVIKLTSEDVERGAQIRGIATSLTQRFTGMCGDQAAITTVAVYKG